MTIEGKSRTTPGASSAKTAGVYTAVYNDNFDLKIGLIPCPPPPSTLLPLLSGGGGRRQHPDPPFPLGLWPPKYMILLSTIIYLGGLRPTYWGGWNAPPANYVPMNHERELVSFVLFTCAPSDVARNILMVGVNKLLPI